MENLKKEIAKNIRAKRKELKLKQHQVAKELNIIQNAVSRLESGNHLISIDVLYKLCKIFNCESKEILKF
jgi:transcriptional regulator with XRE-family HTH domain